jgi:hypothetical protein
VPLKFVNGFAILADGLMP